MKFLPIDISTFSDMIPGNYLYIDKTEQIYNVFKEGKRYHFLSRPRRFGKSLLISTLKELFAGNKELFKGLYIEKTDWPWLEHPVIHLDFGLIAHGDKQQFETSLLFHLDSIGLEHQIDLSMGLTINDKLTFLIKALAKKNKVVLLIDEYDKPILDHIENIEKAKSLQAALKSFYDSVRGLDTYFRAIFITGISKFSKTSVFSGLNNLNDLTMDPIAATLVGYTENELKTNFADYIPMLSTKLTMTIESLMQEIKIWYNGYQFSEESIKVYNPFSVAYLFSKKKFANYWFESGTPTFLVKLLKKKQLEFKNFQDVSFSVSTLGAFNIEKLPFITLLYQTGYLTIADYDTKHDTCRLSYANREIKESFMFLELGVATDLEAPEAASAIATMVVALDKKDLKTFFDAVCMLFASIPFFVHIDDEAYYHSLFQLMGTLIGFKLQSEVVTSKGRIDVVIETDNYVYVLEFKFNKTPQEAMNQIKELRYYEKYLTTHKEIILAGVSFNYKGKQLSIDWLSESIR